MIPIKQVRTILMVLLPASLLASLAAAAASTGVLVSVLAEQIEQEKWRPGGLNSERMLQIFRKAIATKDIEVVAQIQDEVVRQARRGRVDLEPYQSLLSDIEKVPREGTPFENSSVSSVLRREAAFYQLSRSERREIYREALQSQRKQPSSARKFVVRGEVLWENWYTAASAALEEQMDDLVSLIEQGHSAEKRAPDAGVQSLERHLNEVLMPLAKARSSGDWAEEYVSLIRRAGAGDENQRVSPQLVREAALELVAKNRRDVAGPLKEIFSDAYARKERPEKPEDDPAAKSIVGAIRALADHKFEEGIWRKWHPATLEELDRSLTRTLARGDPASRK